ncbi:MAG: hypothetical protein H7067_08175 [Burkholderiales bacterium]|nr:hypothetical protein [Opitutaceae bacterium]
MTPLAQISADQLGPLVPWLVGASAMLFLANQALTFWKEHMREKPIPGETYATKDQMREVHGRIKRERDEINRDIAAAAATAAAVRERLDAALGEMSDKLDTNNEAGREREGRINGRIDDLRDVVSDMPAKIVELLSKTKGLL